MDKKIINWANQLGLPSISIIDHWSWYRKRFELNNQLVLPDFIFVNDDIAYDDALSEGLPSEKIVIAGNPVLESLYLNVNRQLIAKEEMLNLYNLPTTGLRFFTVYGPWGRPDMALFKFTKAILEDVPIEVFNHGKHTRDFTYIDDIVEGIVQTLDNPATCNLGWDSNKPDPATSKAPWRIYNIGNNKPVQLMDYIDALEKALGKKAKINFLPLQPGDVPDTYASTDNLKKKFNYQPSTSVIDGISQFVKWYKNYYQI